MSIVRVGIVSDTHGALRPEALEALAGVDHIIHAGDIGGRGVLLALEAIAPVTAVEGNMDRHGPLRGLREREAPVIGGMRFFVTHDLHGHRGAGIPADARVVVSGHTHAAAIERAEGRLFVNPGSPSSPRRDGPTIALLEVEDGRIDARIVAL